MKLDSSDWIVSSRDLLTARTESYLYTSLEKVATISSSDQQLNPPAVAGEEAELWHLHQLAQTASFPVSTTCMIGCQKQQAALGMHGILLAKVSGQAMFVTIIIKHYIFTSHQTLKNLYWWSVEIHHRV